MADYPEQRALFPYRITYYSKKPILQAK